MMVLIELKSFAKIVVSAILLWGSSGFRTSSLVQYYLKKQKILDKKKFDSVLVMSGRRENVENCISVLGYVLVNLV